MAMSFSVLLVGILLTLSACPLWDTALTDTIPNNTVIHIDDPWPTFTAYTDSQTAGDWEGWPTSERWWMPLCRDVRNADKYVCTSMPSQDKGMVHTLSLRFAGAAVAAAYLFCSDVVNCVAFFVNVFHLSTVKFNSLLSEATFSFTNYGYMTAEPYLDCGNMSYRCNCNSLVVHEFSCRCNVSLHDDLSCRPGLNFFVPSHIQYDLRFPLANNTVHITSNWSAYSGETVGSNANSCSSGCIAASVIAFCIVVLLLVLGWAVKFRPHCRLSKFVMSVLRWNNNDSKWNTHEVSAESQQHKHNSSAECCSRSPECSGANVSEMSDATVSEDSAESCTLMIQQDATEDKTSPNGNCQDTPAEDIVELKESETAEKFIRAQFTSKAIKTSSGNHPKFDRTQVILSDMGDEGNCKTKQHIEHMLNKTEITVISGRVNCGNREVILEQDMQPVECKALKPASVDSNVSSGLEEVVVDNSTLQSC